MRNFVWFMIFLLLVYALWQSAILEALVGLLIATVFNGLFWLLIGRYNPVHSSDEIRVLGMDD